MTAALDPRTLPWSPEAEQSVLGALLLNPDALLRLADRRLQPAHFFDQRHRDVWTAIADMSARRLPVDVLTVFEHLRDRSKAEACGGLEYLGELSQCVPSAANIERHADIVSEKAMRRAIVEAADKAQALAQEAGDADSVLDRVAALFSGIQRTRASTAPRQLGELLAARSEHWERLERGDETPGIPTRLDKLDRALGGGLKPGKVVVLAARPSVGKTSLAQQIGLEVAAQGHGVLMLSQEMPAGDLVDRAAANLARVDLDRLSTGRFQPEDWSRLSEAAEATIRLPFYVDDQPALTLLDIRAKARQVQQQAGRAGLALVIVDYLQLCADSGAHDKRHHQIEQISRGTKQLAKELGVCVLLLSQVGRKATQRDEPELDDLKESGAIEEDADVVLLLHPMGNDPDGGLLILAKLAKNRQGRRGRLVLALEGRTQRWAESSGDVSRQAGSKRPA